MRLGIIVGPGNKPSSWQLYQKSCGLLNIECILIDMKSSDWLKKYQSIHQSIDGLLAGPPCMNIEEYDIYMERLYFIKNEFATPLYPSYDELKLYENKRYCSYWLQKYNYPAPGTKVFCDKNETLSYLDQCDYPIVIKAPIGAGGSAVHLVKNKIHGRFIIKQIYGFHRLLAFGYISWVRVSKIKIPIPLIGSSLRHNVVIQEYISAKWEWRIIKIGDSYFGHQKLLKGFYASGSDRVGWIAPPKHLLDLVTDVCERGGFHSMAMDVFESNDGMYYINELQSMFGSYLDSQMYIDGIPGRYKLEGDEYVFEKGYFNICGSRLLRVKHFAEILSGVKLSLDHIPEIWKA